jgi:hypothetical protein
MFASRQCRRLVFLMDVLGIGDVPFEPAPGGSGIWQPGAGGVDVAVFAGFMGGALVRWRWIPGYGGADDFPAAGKRDYGYECGNEQ